MGQGVELPAWRRRASEAGLGDRIRFAGFRTDVPQILAALDALVHPARYEAYGLSVREALCRGVPAIVSASAGVAEHYPPSSASCSSPIRTIPPSFGATLLAWRRDLERIRSAVVPLSAALRGHTWDAMAEQIAACALEQA